MSRRKRKILQAALKFKTCIYKQKVLDLLKKTPKAPFLPSEILIQIFDYLAPQNTLPHDILHTCHGERDIILEKDFVCATCQVKQLLSVCLVSKHWCSVAQPLLYRVVRIGYSMFVHGDEQAPYWCVNRNQHGQDRYFSNVFDPYKPRILSAERPRIRYSPLLEGRNQEQKLHVLKKRIETLRLFKRTLVESSFLREYVVSWDLAVLFGRPDSPNSRPDGHWFQEFINAMHNRIQEILCMLPALRFIDFHLEPQAVGDHKDALRYIIKNSITRTIWRPRLPDCRCNHVRIQLSTSGATGGAAYTDMETPEIDLGDPRLPSGKTTVYLYSDSGLPARTRSFFTALPSQTSSLEVQHSSCLSCFRNPQWLTNPAFPPITSMRFVGGISMTPISLFCIRSRDSGMPTSIALIDRSLSFEDIQLLLFSAANLQHLRLENVLIVPHPMSNAAPIAPVQRLMSEKLESIYWDLVTSTVDGGGSGPADNDMTTRATECLGYSTGINLPSLKIVSTPPGKPYSEKLLFAIRKVHGENTMKSKAVGQNIETTIERAIVAL